MAAQQALTNLGLPVSDEEVQGLSQERLAAHLRFRYANIEAAHGNYQKQSEILNWLEKTLIRV